MICWILLLWVVAACLAAIFIMAAGRLNRLADRTRDEHEEGAP